MQRLCRTVRDRRSRCLTHDKGTTPTFNNNQALTLNQEHAATGRDRKTLNKRCLEKQYPNAFQQADGRKGWLIPVRDLVEAGDLDALQVSEVESALESVRESRKVRQLLDRVAQLETDVQVHRALAEERLTMIATLRSVVLDGQSRGRR